MEIRQIREDEYDEAMYIGRQAFAHGDRTGTNRWRSPEHPPVFPIGIWDDGGLQARLAILDYQVHFGPNVTLKMGGIGGVCCLPASRGKGYAGRLLKAALEQMRNSGQVISSLFPFSYAFYQKYGWDWVGLSRTYSIPSRLLPVVPETEMVHRAKKENWPAIKTCYTRFSQGLRGMIVRTEQRWNAILNDQETRFTYVYHYVENGETLGYLVICNSSKNETNLVEFIALTPKAQMALLGLLGRHTMQIDKFTWYAPNHDPLLFHLQANELKIKMERVTQGRIVDVAGALSLWKPDDSQTGSVNLAVHDEHAPWNSGTWQAEFANGEVHVQKTTKSPHISLDIQALSQAFYGTPTLDEIRAVNRLEIHDEQGYRSLQHLLSGPPMWTADGF